MTRYSVLLLMIVSWCMAAALPAQKPVWRQATPAELQAQLPARAPVEKEHIETEISTASGITDGHGHFIAGVVLITAGYSAEGKYSHFLMVQAPIRVGETVLEPGEYVFGWTRNEEGLSVHIHRALTGAPVVTAEARHIGGSARVEALRIWPPGDRPLIQIGRFGVPYAMVER